MDVRSSEEQGLEKRGVFLFVVDDILRMERWQIARLIFPGSELILTAPTKAPDWVRKLAACWGVKVIEMEQGTEPMPPAKGA